MSDYNPHDLDRDGHDDRLEYNLAQEEKAKEAAAAAARAKAPVEEKSAPKKKMTKKGGKSFLFNIGLLVTALGAAFITAGILATGGLLLPFVIAGACAAALGIAMITGGAAALDSAPASAKKKTEHSKPNDKTGQAPAKSKQPEKNVDKKAEPSKGKPQDKPQNAPTGKEEAGKMTMKEIQRRNRTADSEAGISAEDNKNSAGRLL